MSQYGAFGQAKEGKTYDEILAYYYSGTAARPRGAKEVRVLLAEGRRALTFSPRRRSESWTRRGS